MCSVTGGWVAWGALAVMCLLLRPAGAVAPGSATAKPGGPVKVEIRKERGGFGLYRGGKPYYVKGAVYWSNPRGRFPLAGLAKRGGNSIRCGGNIAQNLDEAHRLGVTVTVNLRMKMEAVHKFDYDDARAVKRQLERMRASVLKYKDHPALLMWGVGNELSMGYKNRRVWGAVNDVVRMIHRLDPNHPAMTVIGEGSIRRGDIKEIRRRCPDLDLLGINYYKGIEAVPAKVRQDGWDRPYVVTEWGPSGDWQVRRTEWKASIEETSTRKATHYLERYRNTMQKDSERCLGSYVFIWSSRRERTHTWYGMFLDSGERTEAVNVMQHIWSGRWPANRAPRIEPVRIDGRAAEDNVYVEPGGTHVATVKAADGDGDGLTFKWQVLPEVARAGYAGMGERHAKPLGDLIRKADGAELTFAAPATEGAYRMFVFVLDGHGNAATANIPFYVRGRRQAAPPPANSHPPGRCARFFSGAPLLLCL